MRVPPRFSRAWMVSTLVLSAAFAVPGLHAQPAPAPPPAKTPAPEELGQLELTEAYRAMREQLRATQAAIVNNRFEAEAASRAQTAAMAAKLESMNAVLAAERKARQEEADRMLFDREKQRAEIQQSNRSVIWVAAAFGSAGLAAMLFAAFFQSRAIGRMAEVVDRRAALPAPSELDALPAPASSHKAISLSTQRLMSTIERMERRIKELEHTAPSPPPHESRAGAKAPQSVT